MNIMQYPLSPTAIYKRNVERMRKNKAARRAEETAQANARAAERAAAQAKAAEAPWLEFLSSKNLPMNWTKADYEADLRRQDAINAQREHSARIAAEHRRMLNIPKPKPIVRDISGYPVKDIVYSTRPYSANNDTSGLGVNGGAYAALGGRTAGRALTIDKWGNKRYL